MPPVPSQAPSEERSPAPEPVPARSVDGGLTRRVAGAAGGLTAFRFAMMALSAITAALTTRFLGPGDYGAYGSAVATWTLLGATADFGFTIAVTREMAREPDLVARRALIQTAYRVGLVWAGLLSVVLLGLALAAGPGTERGLSMLVLAPSLAFFGLTYARALFAVEFEWKLISAIDGSFSVVQAAVTIGVAAAGYGPVAVATVVSVSTAVNFVAIWIAARDRLPESRRAYDWRAFLRRSVPLGVLGVMTKTYLLIDVILIGWFVTGPTVGDYAAAARFLTVFTGVIGVVTGAALPAFSSHRTEVSALEGIVSRVWHWLSVAALPLFVGFGVYAPLLSLVVLGPEYDGAVPVLRVLAIAGVLMTLNNLFGVLLIALDATRAMFVQNTVAIVLNVGGNVALLPSRGVMAAAWLTVLTEVVVSVGALAVIVRRLDLSRVLSSGLRPVLAIVVATAPAFLVPNDVVGACCSLALYVGLLTALRSWPEEFHAGKRSVGKQAA